MAELWEKVSPGQPPAFSSPEEMWEKAVEYFNWCKDNPLETEKIFSFQGEIVRGDEAKMRAMTKQGLCAFLNISTQTLRNYQQKEDFFGVTSAIEEIMYEQKFSGAAGGLLNANLIARDLGLADKQEIEHSGDSLTPWGKIKAGVDE